MRLNPATMQVILTTHSPYLLDLLDLSHIVPVDRVNGEPTFTRPSDQRLPPRMGEGLQSWSTVHYGRVGQESRGMKVGMIFECGPDGAVSPGLSTPGAITSVSTLRLFLCHPWRQTRQLLASGCGDAAFLGLLQRDTSAWLSCGIFISLWRPRRGKNLVVGNTSAN